MQQHLKKNSRILAFLVPLLLTESESEVLLQINQLISAPIIGSYSSFLPDLVAISQRFDMIRAIGASLIIVEHLAPPVISIVIFMLGIH